MCDEYQEALSSGLSKVKFEKTLKGNPALARLKIAAQQIQAKAFARQLLEACL